VKESASVAFGDSDLCVSTVRPHSDFNGLAQFAGEIVGREGGCEVDRDPI